MVTRAAAATQSTDRRARLADDFNDTFGARLDYHDLVVDHRVLVTPVARDDPHNIGRQPADARTRRQALTDDHANVDVLVRDGALAPQPVNDLAARPFLAALSNPECGCDLGDSG
jgi:hypothetical protein